MRNFDHLTDEKKAELFLDYLNNYLSVACFAEHLEIAEPLAAGLIREGREIHENNCK